jgi:hypothetical protein
MIALCSTCHRQADSGQWTAQQLRDLKRKPYLAGKDIAGALRWIRNEIVLRGGGNEAIGANVFLMVRGRKMVWFTRDAEGQMLLNIDVQTADGNPLFKMEDNDWTASKESADIEAPPGGRKISCKWKPLEPKGLTELALSFEDLLESEYRKVSENCAASNPMVRSGKMTLQEAIREDWDSVSSVISSWPALLVTMTARIQHPLNFRITEEAIQIGNATIGGNRIVACSRAIVLK